MPRTQLLIINADINTSARVKQALEGTRRYDVTPFTDAAAALDYLAEHRQDAVIVDMHLPRASGAELVGQLLEVQPDLTVVASTSESGAAGEALTAGASQLLDARFSARDILNLLERKDNPPPDAPSPDAVQQPESPPVEEDSSLFERLAAEEPPRPALDESGTITDFMAISPEDLDTMFTTNQDAGLESMLEDGDEDMGHDTAAQLILETANDDSVPLADLNPKERKSARGDADYVSEPDFLLDTKFDDFDSFDDLAVDNDDQPTSQVYVDEDTRPSEPLIELDLTDEAEPQQEPEFDDDFPVAQAPADDPATDDDDMRWYPTGDVEIANTADDPKLTQLAVSLTQASLESTAEGTLLTRGNSFVAYDGTLSEDDVTELLHVVVNGWEEIGEQNARIRYVTLSSNGLDYMLYSRRTHEDFILSMVFAGQTALRDIRQQAKRIITALQSVPEMTLEAEAETEDDGQDLSATSRGGIRLETATSEMPFVRHTFVWLLRDPEMALAYATAEAINAGLRVQLIEQGWQVDVLDVAEDYVYLVAGVPSDEPPQRVVRDLQERAARIARAQEPSLPEKDLWADSYFVLSPGRELNLQEIQQYINFYRM